VNLDVWVSCRAGLGDTEQFKEYVGVARLVGIAITGEVVTY
jgi:hypothetical protein